MASSSVDGGLYSPYRLPNTIANELFRNYSIKFPKMRRFDMDDVAAKLPHELNRYTTTIYDHKLLKILNDVGFSTTNMTVDILKNKLREIKEFGKILEEYRCKMTDKKTLDIKPKPLYDKSRNPYYVGYAIHYKDAPPNEGRRQILKGYPFVDKLGLQPIPQDQLYVPRSKDMFIVRNITKRWI